MRELKVLLALALVMGLAFGAVACGPAAEEEAITELEPPVDVIVEEPVEEPVVEEPVVMDTIISVLEADGRFTTLLGLLGDAGLVDTLMGFGPFTLFAPTDDAFAALPAGALDALTLSELTDILLGHVAAERLASFDVLGMADMDLATMSGVMFPITVDGQAVMVGDATVVEADVEGGNGVIHVIDTVLLPAAEMEDEVEEDEEDEG